MRGNFPVRPGTVNLIGVTFLPDTVALGMRDEQGRKYLWVRADSSILKNRNLTQKVLRSLDTTSPGQILTATSNPPTPLYQPGHAASLVRYIQRGIQPEEVPMLMVAYGFLASVAHGDELATLVADTVYADAV